MTERLLDFSGMSQNLQRAKSQGWDLNPKPFYRNTNNQNKEPEVH